jgi:hypothetical protein
VGGNVLAEEVIVKPEGVWGADYVFDEGYDLPSLGDVSTFIEERGHLPDVPPASTVREEGLRLSQMNESLLRKVEELTLYAIEQKNRADSLARHVDRVQTALHEERQARRRDVETLRHQNEQLQKQVDRLHRLVTEDKED